MAKIQGWSLAQYETSLKICVMIVVRLRLGCWPIYVYVKQSIYGLVQAYFDTVRNIYSLSLRSLKKRTKLYAST